MTPEGLTHFTEFLYNELKSYLEWQDRAWQVTNALSEYLNCSLYGGLGLDPMDELEPSQMPTLEDVHSCLVDALSRIGKPVLDKPLAPGEFRLKVTKI